MKEKNWSKETPEVVEASVLTRVHAIVSRLAVGLYDQDDIYLRSVYRLPASLGPLQHPYLIAEVERLYIDDDEFVEIPRLSLSRSETKVVPPDAFTRPYYPLSVYADKFVGSDIDSAGVTGRHGDDMLYQEKWLVRVAGLLDSLETLEPTLTPVDTTDS